MLLQFVCALCSLMRTECKREREREGEEGRVSSNKASIMQLINNIKVIPHTVYLLKPSAAHTINACFHVFTASRILCKKNNRVLVWHSCVQKRID